MGGFGGRRLAELMGPIGVWSFALQRLGAGAERNAVRELEDLGFPATWIPESLGSKEVFVHSSILLGATEKLVIAPGIANIYARDPMAMANAARALGEAYPGRFVLGIGVSHKPSVATRGSEYGKPVETMRRYLDGMAAAQYAAPEPDPAGAARACRARAEDARARCGARPTARIRTSCRSSTPPRRGRCREQGRSWVSSRPRSSRPIAPRGSGSPGHSRRTTSRCRTTRTTCAGSAGPMRISRTRGASG